MISAVESAVAIFTTFRAGHTACRTAGARAYLRHSGNCHEE